MTTYWIADPQGAKAAVGSAVARDESIRLHGWTEASEPQPGDHVWMRHGEHGGRAKFPTEAVEQWAALGWQLAAPTPPPDLTKDPAFVDQLPVAPAAEPDKPKTASAAGGNKNQESSRG